MTDSQRKGPERRDLTRAIKFVEELTWLLDTYKDVDFRALSNLRNSIVHGRQGTLDNLGKYAPPNPNVMFLVGALPDLFSDPSLFPSNEDIAEFATLALKVDIPRWHKKSKFELIGHIVCNAAQLSDKNVEKIVHALQKLAVKNSAARNLVGDRRNSGLTWNDIIRKLNAEDRLV